MALTFSALVDEAVTESRRLERRKDAVRFVRSTIRESQALQLFANDLVEDQIAASATPFIWTPTAHIRTVQTVRYGLGGGYVYPEHVKPGKRQRDLDVYYYKAGEDIIFSGAPVGTLIDIAYYRVLPNLVYYDGQKGETAPASFDIETQAWTYTSATTDEEKETARDSVTNWLIFNWYDLIMEGTLAKLFKSTDDARARNHFSQYKSQQADLVAMASGVDS